MALATTKAPICGLSAKAASSYEGSRWNSDADLHARYLTGILMFNYALIEIDRGALGQGSDGIGGRWPPDP
jgi:hypothetical protein